MSDPAAVAFSEVFFTHGGDAPQIRNCSFQVPEGSITAILGPNGAGKTTLLHLILGWLQPAAGRISLFGTDLRAFTPRQRGTTQSLLPQKEPTGFEYTVLEYVLLGWPRTSNPWPRRESGISGSPPMPCLRQRSCRWNTSRYPA